MPPGGAHPAALPCPGRDACPRAGAAGPGPAEGARAGGTSPQPRERHSLGRGESPELGQVWSLSDRATYWRVAEPGADVGSIFPSTAYAVGLCHMVRHGWKSSNRPYVRPAHKLISASLSQGDCPRNLIMHV